MDNINCSDYNNEYFENLENELNNIKINIINDEKEYKEIENEIDDINYLVTKYNKIKIKNNKLKNKISDLEEDNQDLNEIVSMLVNERKKIKEILNIKSDDIIKILSNSIFFEIFILFYCIFYFIIFYYIDIYLLYLYIFLVFLFIVI
jgi:hypothetical protein